MNNGHIQLHRTLLEWGWYKDANTMRLFIHCLLKANWKDGNFKGNKIDRGSFVTSLASLSEDLELSVKQIRVSLNKLIRTSEVASKSTNKYRIITVKNYDKFQTNGKQEGSQRAVKGQQYNNSNKEIINIYNAIIGLPNIKKISGERLKHLNARHNEYGIETVIDVFKSIHKSDFLCGRSSDWKCDFDWIINPNNFVKILEGKYKNKQTKSNEESKEDYERRIGLK